MSTATAWRSRIVGSGEVAPDQLLANPQNWRVHPKAQHDALSGVLTEVGWVQSVIVNRQTGHLVDGHLRVEAALGRGELAVPVVFVDLTPEEESLILATMDPLSAMATTDKDKLGELLADITTNDAAVQSLFDDLAAKAGKKPATADDPGADVSSAERLMREWGTRDGQVWLAGDHVIVCGDSSDPATIARLGAGSAALVWDPPWDVALPVPTGEWVSTLAFTDGRRAGDVVQALGAPDWVFVWDCVTTWFTPHRPLQGMKLCLWYGDVRTYNAEGAFYAGDVERKAGKGRGRFGGQYEYTPDPRGRHLGDMFRANIAVMHGGDEGLHQHQKPVDWMRCLIGNCTTGDVVDPCMGSGTTIVACQQLHRRAFGIELDPAMVAVTLERLRGMGLEVQLAPAQ